MSEGKEGLEKGKWQLEILVTVIALRKAGIHFSAAGGVGFLLPDFRKTSSRQVEPWRNTSNFQK